MTKSMLNENIIERLIQVPECTLISEPNALGKANSATFITRQKSQAIVQANSAIGVSALLKTARTLSLRVAITSGGKNWGFGSKVPANDCDVLLDLSQMTAISDYDPVFGTVRVEAGVSFSQLAEFLNREGNQHFNSAIGGPPGASVVGNLLEKGDGSGPYWNRAEHFCDPHIVLPDGTQCELGFGGLPNSKLSSLSRHAPGPDLSALLPQSGLAVVTAVTLWLQARPNHFRSYRFKLPDNSKFVPTLRAIRSLYGQNILAGPISVWNDYKQAASSGLRLVNAGTDKPLQRSALISMSNAYNRWTFFGGLYHDNSKLTRLIHKEIGKALRPYVKRSGFFDHLSTRRIAVFGRLNKMIPIRLFDASGLINDWINSPLLGAPTMSGLRSLYLRKEKAPPPLADPHDDKIGVLWNAFEMPFDPQYISELFENLEAQIFDCGFEPVISFIAADHRVIRVYQQLIFDRADPKQDAAALACHHKIFDYLEAQGCSHVRADCLTMQRLGKRLDQSTLFETLKRALDPDGTFCTGHYGA